MDVRDFSEWPANDKGPPKSAGKARGHASKSHSPALGCPDYMIMDAAVTGIPKPQHIEITWITPEKKKVPRGWPACLKRLPPKGYISQQ